MIGTLVPLVGDWIASPKWLDSGDTAWQLTAATLVGLMSIPGLAVLYGGVVQRKFAINSVMMAFYAFSMVLMVWVLWGFNMSFGKPWHGVSSTGFLGNMIGIPAPALDHLAEQAQAGIPELANAPGPSFAFPQSALVYFQFVFAAITPLLFLGSVIGRMSFKAWMLMVPLWSTFIYSVNAFLLWGGGWWAAQGAVDYSGGYVIHLAAGTSGFVAAAVIGPRLNKDRSMNSPNNLLMVMAGAGLLWMGWNGFNGGDPYFANADAASAVLNTNIAAATAMLTWMFIDVFAAGKPSLTGSVNGMITGLVAITPAAGFVNGTGAIAIGVAAAAIPWFTMNKVAIFRKVDDALGVVHTHGIAGLIGGLMVGLVADPKMLEYVGTKGSADISIGGWFLNGHDWHQFNLQAGAALTIIVFDAIGTFVILKLIGLVVPLRMSVAELEAGDEVLHGEEAHAPVYVPAPAPVLPGLAVPRGAPALAGVGHSAEISAPLSGTAGS
ncbi:MAG TPA: ammonium transporter [Chloroflexota bacterium]|nr:ammonium transporter [Chloroflexota bacterium]